MGRGSPRTDFRLDRLADVPALKPLPLLGESLAKRYAWFPAESFACEVDRRARVARVTGRSR